MKKGIFLILAFIFLIFPLASAIDTNITLYTKPLVDARLLVLDPGSTYYLLQSYPSYHTGFDGKMNVLYTGDKIELGIMVIIKKDGKNLYTNRLDNQPAGGEVKLYVLVNESDVVEIVSNTVNEDIQDNVNNSIELLNSSVNNTPLSPQNLEISNSSKKSIFEGLSISPVKEVISKNKNYFLGGFVFILLVFLTIIIVFKRGKFSGKRSENYSDDRPPTILYDKKIEDAERRIKQAQKEIEELRNFRNKSSEISEARRKYEEAKRNLERVEKSSSYYQDIKSNRHNHPHHQDHSHNPSTRNTNLNNSNNQQNSNNFSTSTGNVNQNKPDVKDKSDVKDFDFRH